MSFPVRTLRDPIVTLVCSCVLGVLVLTGAWGCGPSVRQQERSARYFETCHLHEVRRDISTRHRQQCWRQWLQDYAAYQPHERVNFAMRRSSSMPRVHETAPAPPVPPQDINQSKQENVHHLSCSKHCAMHYERCEAPCIDRTPRDGCMEACKAERRVCEKACP